MTAHHRVTAADFHDLARGSGGPDTVAALAAGQRSRSMLLLRGLVDLAARHPALPGPLPPPDEAWRLLLRAERRRAATVDRMLLHPQVGVWRHRCLRRLRDPGTDDTPLWQEAGYLHAVAASAALLAGLDFRIAVPVRDGAVMLPALGLVRLDGHRTDTAEVHQDPSGRRGVTAGPVRVPLPDELGRDAPGWRALRRLAGDHAGHRCAPLLDDLDPYRRLLRPSRPERLGEAEARRWQRDFARAWALIAEQDNVDPGGVGACCTSLVPVRPPGTGPFSASSPTAYGCVLLSRPPDAAVLAASLIHEAQHIKLSALLDLVPLMHGGWAAVHYAPWRADPRPLRAILQGVYAFLGVTGFWQSRLHRETDPAARRTAALEFALRRAQTAQGLGTLRGHAELTVRGRRFLDGVAERLDGWLAEPVPEPARRAAEDLCTDHRVLHRLHHRRPGRLEPWARAWRAGLASPGPPEAGALHPGPYREDTRSALARLWAGDPRAAAALRDRAARTGDLRARADGDWAARDPAGAARGYRARLKQAPDDTAAWAGLALTLPEGPARRALREVPETVYALHRTLRANGTGTGPDPVALAGWLYGAA
ncbi:aKG-HExxH-type peptide beta-hydroxylase [Streptomyces sp. NPDC018031]|uniref:aKG-HExxH-type peptide beta-hydroxylase n=1 Tax=Streptomyces sp. NPDC018031 TaxID=3365033 RepID=UPI0037ACBA26